MALSLKNAEGEEREDECKRKFFSIWSADEEDQPTGTSLEGRQSERHSSQESNGRRITTGWDLVGLAGSNGGG
jgi:hypothetical protein